MVWFYKMQKLIFSVCSFNECITEIGNSLTCYINNINMNHSYIQWQVIYYWSKYITSLGRTCHSRVINIYKYILCIYKFRIQYIQHNIISWQSFLSSCYFPSIENHFLQSHSPPWLLNWRLLCLTLIWRYIHNITSYKYICTHPMHIHTDININIYIYERQ